MAEFNVIMTKIPMAATDKNLEPQTFAVEATDKLEATVMAQNDWVVYGQGMDPNLEEKQLKKWFNSSSILVEEVETAVNN